jgi:H+/Cl- antiporter ClcA
MDKFSQIMASHEYYKTLLWVILLAIIATLATLIYFGVFTSGTDLVWHTIPAMLPGLPMGVYTVVVPALNGFMAIEFTGLLNFPLYWPLIPAGIAALIGMLIFTTVSGVTMSNLYHFEDEGGSQTVYLLYAFLLGLVGVVVAFIFKLINGSIKKLAALLAAYPIIKPVIGGVIFGLIGVFLPLTMFSGEHQLETIIEQGATMGLAMLLTLSLVKLFTLSLCLNTDFPGGFIFPVLFSSGTMGMAIHLLFPAIPASVAVTSMMASTGGAVMRMPITIILVVMLVTSPDYIPHLIIAGFTAYLLANLLQAGSARRACKKPRPKLLKAKRSLIKIMGSSGFPDTS